MSFPPTKTTTASIPLHVESTGKKIKVGVQLMNDESNNNTPKNNNNNNSNIENSDQTMASPPAAVSAGMLRALIQGRFGDDAQLCDQNGEVIPDSDIIWARDVSGNVSVKNKMQISTTPTPRSASSMSGNANRFDNASRSASSANAMPGLVGTKPVHDYSQNNNSVPAKTNSKRQKSSSQPEQQQEQPTVAAPPSSSLFTTSTTRQSSSIVPKRNQPVDPNTGNATGPSTASENDQQLAFELTQQVHQRTRQLHVARTLLDTDRLKWNQQLDLLTQLRDIAVEIIAMQRQTSGSDGRLEGTQSPSSSDDSSPSTTGIKSGNDRNASSTCSTKVRSIEQLVQQLKEQQRQADENLARQQSRRVEVAEAESALDLLEADIGTSLATCQVNRLPQHSEAPRFLRDTILNLAVNQILVEDYDDQIAQLQNDLAQVRRDRRAMVEGSEKSGGFVRVVVRQRPYLREVDGSQPKRLGAPEVGTAVVDEENRTVVVASPATGQRDFEFVKTFSGTRNSVAKKQQEIFDEEIIPLLRESISKGTNACFLLYGPTGSGKSFTLFGNASSQKVVVGDTNTNDADEETEKLLQQQGQCSGLLEMALSEIIQFSGEADVQASELHLDKIHDLLDPTANNNNNKNKHSSDACCWIRVKSVKQAAKLVHKAALRRVTAKTLTNETSSRSHMIVNVRFPILIASPDGVTTQEQAVTATFVDLAGSERVSRSMSSGDRLKEAQHINRSLSALGDVVQALSNRTSQTSNNGKVHVPYRNSKLTQILQTALGGGGGGVDNNNGVAVTRTVLMLCIPPHLPEQHNLSEIVSTLSFGIRARGVSNGNNKS